MGDPLQCGQIIWTEMTDANGICKTRPAVVVTPDERITETGPLDIVAITSRLPDPLPDDHVLLPWHRQGHPRTRLNRKCAAVCSWVARIDSSSIQTVGGLLTGPALAEILSKIPPLMTSP